MQRTWIDRSHGAVGAATLVFAFALSGCATNTEDLLSHDSGTMRDIWDASTGAGMNAGAGDGPADRRLLDARLSLRRPPSVTLNASPTSPGAPRSAVAIAVDLTSYTRTAQNEIQRQFQRLPNPDLVMYVFPHVAGTDPVPVPGYSTVFPLYQRVQYAMPGERVEDY
jgi:conjugative transfer region lipoprotein (TIGR03751 family)